VIDRYVIVFEMSAWDGLQNEPIRLNTEAKIRLVNMLSDCGLEKIEVTSFVSPKLVPQIADADLLLSGITRRPRVSYTVLTPNLVGFERAVEAGVDEVAVFASASEGFSQKNINCKSPKSTARFTPVRRSKKSRNFHGRIRQLHHGLPL
jgi:hydroxymethylglutaryl-CoA lyase